MNQSSKTGLVGFFDILGYQNLLERNEPDVIAKEVLPILTGIGEAVASDIKGMIPPDTDHDKKKTAEEILDSINWLVFSDTILLTMPVDSAETPYVIFMRWLTFLSASVALHNTLFAAGLPARGAIDYGKFFIQDTCFAGRTIVSAYKLCSQIELSACVLSSNATNELNHLKKLLGEEDFSKSFDHFVIEYLVPMKEREQHMQVVMAHSYDFDHPNIHSTVMRAFWGNRKDIAQSARPKATNTEQWLEFLENTRSLKNTSSTNNHEQIAVS